MTDQGSPIQIKELLQLTTLGINEGHITDNSLTMPSDKYIFVREKCGPYSEFVIIDMANPTNPVRRDLNAYYAAMNPASKIIALDGYCFSNGGYGFSNDEEDDVGDDVGDDVELFNLETESRMKRHKMSELVRFMKWINAETLAIVTDTEVSHWSTEGKSEPGKVFDIDPRIDSSYSGIIDYRCDEKLQWLLLIGVPWESPHDGVMQLYSEERGISEILERHAAAFTQFQVEGNSEPSTLLCLASRTPQGGKLHIKELGQPTRGHQPYTKKYVDVYFPPEAKDDIPRAMQTSSKHDIIYLITRSGYVHLYDVETASLIYTSRMSDHDILVTVPHEVTSGIIGVNKKGQVLSVSVDEDNFIPYIKNVLKNSDLAFHIAMRNNLPGAEDIFLQKFNTLRSRGQYGEVEKLAQNAREVYFMVLCKIGITEPEGETSTEEQLVKRKATSSLFLSKEAGKFCTPGLPAVPEENKFREDFKELFFSKEDCDVVLKVKGQEFPAHQLILKARSPVFAATFRNPMKEKATGIVNIEDCDTSSFSDFLCFLYCADGSCISEENVFSLFKAADKYDVKDLRSKCINFMKENLSVDNFCDTLVIALQYSETDLFKFITEFYIKNAPKIVVTLKWQLFLGLSHTEQ